MFRFAVALAISLHADGVDDVAMPAAYRSRPAAAKASHEVSPMKLRLTIGARSLTATLLDSDASRDFASLLPLTLTLNDLFGREKYGHLPRPLSEPVAVPTPTRSDRSSTGLPGPTWPSSTARTTSGSRSPGSSSSGSSRRASRPSTFRARRR